MSLVVKSSTDHTSYITNFINKFSNLDKRVSISAVGALTAIAAYFSPSVATGIALSGCVISCLEKNVAKGAICGLSITAGYFSPTVGISSALSAPLILWITAETPDKEPLEVKGSKITLFKPIEKAVSSKPYIITNKPDKPKNKKPQSDVSVGDKIANGIVNTIFGIGGAMMHDTAKKIVTGK